MKSHIISFLFVLLFFSCQLSQKQEAQCVQETYAAFDIGSGSTKLMVADRDTCSHQITKIYVEKSKAVGFSQDLSLGARSENFSLKIKKEAQQAMQELMQEAQLYQPDKIVGVATQAFRQAKNGQNLIDQWNKLYRVNFRIISQLEEAQLAYKGVQKDLGRVENSRLVVWDIGGGSQQVSWFDENNHFQTFQSDIASVTFKNELIKKLSRTSPNPLAPSDLLVAQKVLQSMMERFDITLLRHQLKTKPLVIGLGGVHGKSVKNQLKLKSGEMVTVQLLRKTIEKRRLLTDEQIGGPYASTEVSNLLLILYLMEAYQIERYRIREMSLAHSLVLNPDF